MRWTLKNKIRYKDLISINRARTYSKLSYVHNPGDVPLRSMTVGTLLEESAKKYGDRPAVISKFQNQTLTFQEALVQADKLAAGLKTIGFNPGDRVGIWAPNLIEWYVTHMACARGGYVLVNINPAYQPQEIKNCINSVKMKGIICSHTFKTQDYYKHLVNISPEIPDSSPGKLRSKDTPSLESIIILSDGNLRPIPMTPSCSITLNSLSPDGLAKYFKKLDLESILNYSKGYNLNINAGKTESLLFGAKKNQRAILQKHLKSRLMDTEIFDLPSEADVRAIQSLQEYIDPDNICHLQFTSGTTGKPKAPMQTHFHLVNNSYFIGRRNELDRKHHIVCVQVPFFHVFGTTVSICSALNHGATLVLPAPSFDCDKSLDALRDEKCTIVHGTPTMYVDLVNRQEVRKEKISVEIALSGGAICSPSLFKKMKDILGVRKVKSTYGLSETTAVIFQSLYDDDEYLSTSTVGYVAEHLEVKVVDPKGKIVPRGSPGELLIRGYCNTVGYWENEEKTKELMGPDNWLRTGDQFVLEENGYGRIVGRLKELIIRGGENIFPRDIEDILNTHPHILETQVVGIPHDRLGEEVCACIRVEENVLVTLEEIKSFCKGKIAHFKIPSALKIVDSFPKTTSGKIQKFQIVQEIVNKK